MKSTTLLPLLFGRSSASGKLKSAVCSLTAGSSESLVYEFGAHRTLDACIKAANSKLETANCRL